MNKTAAPILLLLVFCGSIFAQGSLTPPAAPAPTMKTLNQIEGRTVIDPSAPGFTTPYNITQPGSYYLSGNINISNNTGAIVIAAKNVTLDLNGFGLISTSASHDQTAIQINGVSGSIANVLIRNGHISGGVTFSGGTYSGPGFADAIAISGSPTNVRVLEVAVYRCAGNGINVGEVFLYANSNSLVERCSVTTVGGIGVIASKVVSVSVSEAGLNGISADLVDDSYGASVISVPGISATTVRNSYGISVSGSGIGAAVVDNSYGKSTSGKGIASITASNSYGVGVSGVDSETVTNCLGEGTTGPGIQAQVANNSEGTSNSGTGLRADLVATNCRGVSSSGIGLDAAVTANSCFGSTASSSAVGLKAGGAANVSGGQNSAGGVALQAPIAIGCNLFGGTSNVPAGGKFLGTP